ncbi:MULTISPECIES: hypothetical protein [unclassified Streptomyces]|uniref:hypothetical protein n=1 Tax=unclassified Streptomyces TaxID=2593676 RepID=UPI002E2BCBBF|nr:hypothetical protein [Streptomyces sp. NBC_00223]
MSARLRTLLRLKSNRGFLWAFLMTAAFVALPVCVLVPTDDGLIVAVAASYLTDELVKRTEVGFARRLQSLGITSTLRFLFRTAVVIVAFGRSDAPTALVASALAVYLLHFLLTTVYAGLHRSVRRRRAVPVITRNLDLSALRLLPQMRPVLSRRNRDKFMHLDLAATAGLLVGLAGGSWAWAWTGLAVTVVLSLAAVALMLVQVLRASRTPSPETVIGAVNEQLADYRPQVALYFTFAAVSQDFMYQVNMWIETLESLDLRPIIILRERGTYRFLSRTWIPVVCVPKAADLAELDLTGVRVVLYPGNAGKNVHMLRVAEARHVFIGHGDSDKLASSNRFSKVYDEIWVAGRAGRDRYQRVRHAIDDAAIVEVGRPQLAPIAMHADHRPGPIPVVLYAPTWEGWSDDDCHTSVIPMGVRMIEALLAQKDPVRVIYKPHPLTGRRSPEAAAADAQIRALLFADNATRAAAQADPAAEARMREIAARLEELTGQPAGGLDDAQLLRTSKAAERAGGDEWTSLHEEWHRLFWEQQGAIRHNVVVERMPALYECFNQADILISDVSSVVADFVASLKPYVLTNAGNLPDEEFRASFTTAGGAYLLDRECTRLSRILDSVRKPDSDPMAEDRRTLKEYVLGPDRPTSMERFNSAVRALADKAAADEIGHYLDGPVVPAQITSLDA